MKINFNEFVISKNQRVMDCIEIIEKSNSQIAYVVDEGKKLLGVVTNGDIRRLLMRGGSSESNVSECMNVDFRYVLENTSREEVLKLFDIGFRVVPVLNDDGILINHITPDYYPLGQENEILSRARAPVRISFSGGGSDLTYYFRDSPGAVLLASIAKYAHTTLIPNQNAEIRILSHDIDREERYRSLRELIDSESKGLLSSVVSVIRPDFGFELFVHSDFPVGSGLGGSSAVAVSVVSAFNEFRLDKWTKYEIAEIAFQAERLCYGVGGGWQDQYASAFGGFNLIEFEGTSNFVHSIRLDADITDELEECLLLCNTKITHDSGQIHAIQRNEFTQEDSAKKIKKMVKLSHQMHKFLIRGDLKSFGVGLDKAWSYKHGLSSAISDSRIDNIYKAARNAGALGGKLLGAGAGGFFLFFVLPRNRAELLACLNSFGCEMTSLHFETQGVKSWSTKAL